MKSIVQEASSVEKAIQRAWEEAGFPSEFSVRVLEHPKHSFFFFLRRSAKVALVFPSQAGKKPVNERTRDFKKADNRTKKDSRAERVKKEAPTQKSARTTKQEASTQKTASPVKKTKETINNTTAGRSELSKALSSEQKTLNKQATPQTAAPTPEQKPVAPQKIEQRPLQQQVWDDELVSTIKIHLTDLLNLMNKTACAYTTEIKGRELFITFSGFVLENEEQDRRLFSGLSPLLMTMVKREFKKALRGYRIVLGHAK